MTRTTPPPKRVRNPRGQGDALREEILDATWRILDDQVRVAALALSLREVAREVGITAQSIYRHFANKEQLAYAVLSRGYTAAVGAMRTAQETLPPNSRADERLRLQAHAFCTFASENRGVVRLMFGYSIGRLDMADADTVHPAAVLWHQWIAAVRACEDGGVVWATSTEETALRLWASLLGVFTLMTSTFSTSDSTLLAALIDQIVDGLLDGSVPR